MNQSNKKPPFYKGKKPVFKILGIILLALLAWAAFNQMVNIIANKIKHEGTVQSRDASGSTTQQHCASFGDYKKRVSRAFSAYELARNALIKEIKMAKYMSYPATSIKYHNLNDADMNAAKQEDAFSKLARLNGTYTQALSCHQGKDASDVKPYLYALKNLTIADNLLYQARGEISAKCNPHLSAYMPYINAANQAVDMAKQDISGKINARDNADYLVRQSDKFSGMKDIQSYCH